MPKPIFKDFRSFWLWAKAGEGVKRDDSVREVRVSTAAEFERLFADANSHNYYIADADDLESAAFLVVNGDGVVRYSITMSVYLKSVVGSS